MSTVEDAMREHNEMAAEIAPRAHAAGWRKDGEES